MILIAIGSNLDSDLYGFPLENCVNVVNFLRKYFFVIKVSNFYETEPIPKSNQPWYVNGVVEIKTNLKPKDIIKIDSGKISRPYVLNNEMFVLRDNAIIKMN